MRVTPLVAISIFFARNIFLMVRHYFQPLIAQPACHKLLLIKSNVSFVMADPVEVVNTESVTSSEAPSEAIVEPGSSATPHAPLDSNNETIEADNQSSSHVAQCSDQNAQLNSVQSMLELADFEHESAVPGMLSSSAHCSSMLVDDHSAVASIASSAAPVSTMSFVISASPTKPSVPVASDTMPVQSRSAGDLTLHLMSAFAHEFESAPQTRHMLLGQALFGVWQSAKFRIVFFVLYSATATLCFIGEVHRRRWYFRIDIQRWSAIFLFCSPKHH
jgi:hypothetical protein